jgi:hypothetical protein
MRIELTQTDMDEAGPYVCSENCLLATKLKKLFPDSQVYVLPYSVKIGSKLYLMSEDDAEAIHAAYYPNDPLRKEFPFSVEIGQHHDCLQG